MSTFFIFSEAEIIGSLIKQIDDLFLKASLFNLLHQDLLSIFLELGGKFNDFVFVFSATSDEWSSFINLTFNFGRLSLFSGEELIAVGLFLVEGLFFKAGILSFSACDIAHDTVLFHSLERFLFNLTELLIKFSLNLLFVQFLLLDLQFFLFKFFLILLFGLSDVFQIFDEVIVFLSSFVDVELLFRLDFHSA